MTSISIYGTIGSMSNPGREINWKSIAPYALVFLIAYGAHFLSGVIASGDSRWSVPGAYSLVHEGNLNLDEFPQLLEESDYYWVEEIDGHYYNRFPIGMSVLSAPFVLVLDYAARTLFWVSPDLEDWIIQKSVEPLEEVTVITMYWRIELVIACFFISIAAMALYRVARETLIPARAAILLFWFLFCCSVWSTGSRALGQHCGSILMITLALLGLVLAKERPKLVQFIAIPLAFSFLIRPTNALPIVAFTIYIVWNYREYTWKYLAWAALITVPFFIYNLSLYGSLLSPYYLPHEQLGEASPYEFNFWDGFFGLLISPGRGLFIYTPLFLLSFLGAWLGYRKTRDLLFLLLLLLFLVYWLVLSSFGDWWGGHSYGPRYFTELSPLFIFLLIPLLQIQFERWNWKRIALTTALTLTTLISFAMHLRGATDLESRDWNREPTDINESRERLWDWEDPPFLRGL